MRITNVHGLPQVLVDAILADPYRAEMPEGCAAERYITATQLVRPPQMHRLLREHYDEMVEDASERLWALSGQAKHSVIERAAKRRTDLLSEMRLYGTHGEWTIGGRIDLFDLFTRELLDIKETSVWSVLSGLKRDWHLQLNILAWLLRRNGYVVDSASIIWLARDWSRTKAKFERSGGDYPAHPAGKLDANLLPDEEVEEFLDVALGALTEDQPRPCTDAERWRRGGGWAVMRKGRKRAARIFEVQEAADYFIAAQEDPEEYFLEGREAVWQRCEAYCPVRMFCQQAASDGITFPEPIRPVMPAMDF